MSDITSSFLSERVAVNVTASSGRWAETFRLHHDRLIALATFLAGDARVAEDVVADVFVRIHDRIDTVDDIGPFLRTAVVNGVRDAHRRRIVRLRPLPGPRPEADPVGDVALATDEQQRLWAAVRGLPARQRECVVLRFQQDLPEAEIASTLGISRTAVNTHLERARTRLSAELEGLR